MIPCPDRTWCISPFSACSTAHRSSALNNFMRMRLSMCRVSFYVALVCGPLQENKGYTAPMCQGTGTIATGAESTSGCCVILCRLPVDMGHRGPVEVESHRAIVARAKQDRPLLRLQTTVSFDRHSHCVVGPSFTGSQTPRAKTANRSSCLGRLIDQEHFGILRNMNRQTGFNTGRCRLFPPGAFRHRFVRRGGRRYGRLRLGRGRFSR